MFCEVEKKLNESKLENEKQRVITAEKEVTFEKEFQEEQRRTEKALIEHVKYQQEVLEDKRVTYELIRKQENDKTLQLIEATKYQNEKKEIEVILEYQQERCRQLEAERINETFQRQQLEQRIADMQQEADSRKNKKYATKQHKKYQDAAPDSHQNSVMKYNSAIPSNSGWKQNAAPDSHQKSVMQHNSAISSYSDRNQNAAPDSHQKSSMQKVKSFFKRISNSSELE